MAATVWVGTQSHTQQAYEDVRSIKAINNEEGRSLISNLLIEARSNGERVGVTTIKDGDGEITHLWLHTF